MTRLSSLTPELYVPRSSFRVVEPPAAEPLTVDEVRDDLGLADNPPAGVIQRMITSARELAEAYTGRAFITQTIEMQLDTFPHAPMPWWDGVRQGARRALASDGPITLYRAPAQEITSITYVDQANTARTVDATTYYLDQVVEPNRVLLIEGAGWPVDPRTRAAVTITYTAGYGDDRASVPAIVAEALLAHLRDLMERPNAAISSQTIDNATTVYGAQGIGVAGGASPAGALRGAAAEILAPLRIAAPV